jgi:hypothetical protein
MKLKRYTSLPQLLHLLATRTLTVLSPKTWDDQNDTYYIQRYRESLKLKALRVLCLTKAADTYHHWHVFAGGSAGVKIDFNPEVFTQWVKGIKDARLEEVEYLKLNEIREGELKQGQLPFVKRWAFRHEGEVRLIVPDRLSDAVAANIPFDVSMIQKITLSPWLTPSLVEVVEAAIQNFAPDGKFVIRRTTLLANKSFMAAADRGV